MLVKSVLYLHLVAELQSPFHTPFLVADASIGEVSFLPISFDRPVVKDTCFETLLQPHNLGLKFPTEMSVLFTS